MQEDNLLPAMESPQFYQCPGERAPLSRSLHLARLASGWGACRDCIHRTDTGLLPRRVVSQSEKQHGRQRASLISPAGLRGLVVNDLSRERMTQIIFHILEMIEEERFNDLHEDARGPLRVLMGYDSRSSSPDLALGVMAALKLSGCEIADTGLTTRPIFDFTLEHDRPHVGLFLTGGIEPAGWNGLDILDGTAIPWTAPGKLETLEARLSFKPSRRARSPGDSFQIDLTAEYHLAISQLFHALRPLRIAIHCPDRIVRNILKQQFENSPCSVYFINSNLHGSEKSERRHRSLEDVLCERRLDVGFQLGEDARTCRVFDEGGHELRLEEILQIIQQAPTFCSSSPWADSLPEAPAGESSALSRGKTTIVQESGCREQTPDNSIMTARTQAELLQFQRQMRIPLAADEERRFWFLDGLPTCDAIQSLAKVMEVLSRSDRPVSAYRTSKKRTRVSHL